MLKTPTKRLNPFAKILQKIIKEDEEEDKDQYIKDNYISKDPSSTISAVCSRPPLEADRRHRPRRHLNTCLLGCPLGVLEKPARTRLMIYKCRHRLLFFGDSFFFSFLK